MFLLREGVVIKHYIDDTLFFAYPNVCCRMEIYYYCPLNPKTTPLTFRKTEVWLSAYHGQAPFVKK